MDKMNWSISFYLNKNKLSVIWMLIHAVSQMLFEWTETASMAPFKQHVAWTFLHDRAGLKCSRCGYARWHTESGHAQGDGWVWWCKPLTGRKKYQIINVFLKQPQPLTWKRKNTVMLNNWVDSESLLGNHIIQQALICPWPMENSSV